MLQTDILIVGAGITGCAAARELSRYNASICVVDQSGDVAEGATKANSGIVHAGYDAVPGTLKARYNVRGAGMYPALCESLGVPYRNGSLTPENAQSLERLIFSRQIELYVLRTTVLCGIMVLANLLYAGGTACGSSITRRPGVTATTSSGPFTRTAKTPVRL